MAAARNRHAAGEAGLRFAENLRAARAERAMSQEGLARASGLHRTEISLLERAEREPRLSTILLVARGLGVEPAELMDGVV